MQILLSLALGGGCQLWVKSPCSNIHPFKLPSQELQYEES
jgi:hypothetical protein